MGRTVNVIVAIIMLILKTKRSLMHYNVQQLPVSNCLCVQNEIESRRRRSGKNSLKSESKKPLTREIMLVD